jgi:hypothetical protein
MMGSCELIMFDLLPYRSIAAMPGVLFSGAFNYSVCMTIEKGTYPSLPAGWKDEQKHYHQPR